MTKANLKQSAVSAPSCYFLDHYYLILLEVDFQFELFAEEFEVDWVVDWVEFQP